MCRNCMKFNVDGSEYFVFAELFLEETAVAFSDDAKRVADREKGSVLAASIEDTDTDHKDVKVVAV
jgi:hypothetical protein